MESPKTQHMYTVVNNLLLSGQKLVLARIIRRSGSTPRETGSMCVITGDGKLIGTVGGGLLEYKVQQQAEKLLKNDTSFVYEFQLTGEDIAKAGMICGGNTDLYLEVLTPENPETVSMFQDIQDHIDAGKSGILATRIKDGISSRDSGLRAFVTEDGTAWGKIKGVDPKTITLKKNSTCDLAERDGSQADIFIERVSLNPKVFLFGAGHVSMFVAKLAKMVGFNTVVIDDRKEFASKERFPDADKIIVTPFEKAFDQITVRQSAYIVIFTRGHLYDKVVLQHALGTNASYIGMIGSTRKRNLIYEALMEQGFKEDVLKKVYSPIGLDINAQTPEEIAVSITGELIKKRNPEKKSKKLVL